jgi:hypothetical protein
MLLRIDDIVSGIRKKAEPGAGGRRGGAEVEDADNVDSERALPE